ncbi:MAG: hypothetical protein FJ216_09800 [Ignavibacteria bacterium]|nr:hypothetical protein [Ignavibacteria bacterium]
MKLNSFIKILATSIIFTFANLLFVNHSAYSQAGNVWFTTILKEAFFDKGGNPLTGKGVLIGDVDSGIDVFHPMFFFADGGEFEWIDVNEDELFTQGIDGVDFNKNGIVDESEKLIVLEIKDKTMGKVLKNDKKKFEPDLDFLFMDENNNSRRDYGIKDGFTEEDATYGEQLFVAVDKNRNNILDPGEKIIALKTSKIRAVREKNGTIRRRGIDLILTEPDTIGHGTGVAGIILGGHYGIQRLHGFAPDAEIVMANISYDYTPRFVRNFPDMIRFLRDEKINILLFEDGEWAWEFMDGSTEEEQITDEMARNGILIVGGGGNLVTGNMHIKDTIQKGIEKTYNFTCPEKSYNGKKIDGVFPSILWTEKDIKINVKLTTPEGKTTNILNEGSEFFTLGNYNIFYSKDISPRGTSMFRFGMSEKDSGSVKGNWSITLMPEENVVIDGYLADVTQEWGYVSEWNKSLSDESTVTFPCTSDSTLAIGAYVVNVVWFPSEEIGSICAYSGRGYNINGKPGIEITAPGHNTYTVSTDFGYMDFSGTSSAAPHVVGTAALLLQYDPTLNHTDIKEIFRKSATTDRFTGKVPNTTWGWGKLNPENAIRQLKSKE